MFQWVPVQTEYEIPLVSVSNGNAGLKHRRQLTTVQFCVSRSQGNGNSRHQHQSQVID